MTIMLFSLDTTGLLRFDRPASDETQPRLVAMACAMFNSKWEQKGYFEFITKPDGVASQAEAKSIHGVTERERELYGVDHLFLMAAFMRFVRLSGEVATFNMPFAAKMLEIEFDRLKALNTDWIRGGLKRTCIRDEAGARWNNGKPMNIQAAHEAATGIAYAKPAKDKHVKDVRAAARIVMELRRK